MKPADFAEHEVTLHGAWTDYRGHRRYLGALTCAVPIAAVSFVQDGERVRYSKTGRRTAPSLEFDLVMQPVFEGTRFQPVLRIGDAVNCEAMLGADRPVEIPDTRTFRTGHLVDLAEPDRSGPTIRLLVLADEDLRSRRSGIWAVKRAYEPQLAEPWATILTATRHGRAVLEAGAET